MTGNMQLWRIKEENRWFLLPAGDRVPGPLVLRDLTGSEQSVDPEWLRPYEVSEEQAHRWAREELGETLAELRHGIDEKLADARRALDEFKRAPAASAVSGDAGPALLDFLKSLPGVIGQSLSGDPQRVDAARETLARLQQRLRESGIDVDDRMKGFADRLASIRDEPKDKT